MYIVKRNKILAVANKRSIESDSKEINTVMLFVKPPWTTNFDQNSTKDAQKEFCRTNISNINQSDLRYKGQQPLSKQSESAARAQLINSKNERSWRLPFDSYLNEESKRSQDHSIKGTTSVTHPENISEILAHKFDYNEAQRMNMGSSNYTNDTYETDHNNISFFIRKIKEQESIIDDYKAKEVTYKDRIYNLEKDLRDANHRLELSTFEHEREITSLNKKLEMKNNELLLKMEDFIMNKLDLDEYNLTSDDFRSSEQESKTEDEKKKEKIEMKWKGNISKIHPLVPKLDLQKIFDWRDRNNNDNIIMIRISESRIEGEDQITEEINDEEGLEKINKKFFPRGSSFTVTSTRISDMFERKQMIINALNQAYTDDEDTVRTPKADEDEEDH